MSHHAKLYLDATLEVVWVWANTQIATAKDLFCLCSVSWACMCTGHNGRLILMIYTSYDILHATARLFAIVLILLPI